MNEIGIDSLCFYTPPQQLPLSKLAKARNIDVNKFHIGLGQQQMSVAAPGEDIITMAASAAKQLLSRINKDNIRMVIFATESSVDQSKSAGLYLHKLLELPSQCRVIELKQACYSGTVGLQMAVTHVQAHPTEQVLILAADIPRYGLGAAGESSHGAGAVAMNISINPRTITIQPSSAYFAEDKMDFWRPNYSKEAIVFGKLSCELYHRFLHETWSLFTTETSTKLSEIDCFCFHVPIPRLAEKALVKLLKNNHIDEPKQKEKLQNFQNSLIYSRRIGNCYTASLYISLISLLDHAENLSEQKIGFYSYGSGSTAEFFCGTVQPGYKQACFSQYHTTMIEQRSEITMEDYEYFYNFEHPTDGQCFPVPEHPVGSYRLTALEEHKRIYSPQPSDA